MNILIDKSFEKDTVNVKDKVILNKIADCIIKVQEASKLTDIKNLKKLAGFEKENRIRIGDYRIGIIFENNTREFIRCLHRKEIYKYFP